MMKQSQVNWVEKLSNENVEEHIQILTTSVYILEAGQKYFEIKGYKVILSDGIIEKEENDGNFIYELFAKPMKQISFLDL